MSKKIKTATTATTKETPLFDYMYLVPKHIYHQLYPEKENNAQNPTGETVPTSPIHSTQQSLEKKPLNLGAKSQKLLNAGKKPTAISMKKRKKEKTSLFNNNKMQQLTNQRLNYLLGRGSATKSPVLHDKNLASNIVHELRRDYKQKKKNI